MATLTEQEIWNKVFDPADNTICVDTPNPNSNHPLLSKQEIWNKVYDPITKSFRTK